MSPHCPITPWLQRKQTTDYAMMIPTEVHMKPAMAGAIMEQCPMAVMHRVIAMPAFK
jgi:hypothetical protein